MEDGGGSMDGPVRAQANEAARNASSTGRPSIRPRDAATLILLDRTGGEIRVLMGRRHMGHVFMPGKFVFPGGRTDPTDSRVKVATGLHPQVERKLAGTSARARGIALSALRETYEEAGLLIGARGDFQTRRADWRAFAEHGVCPSLERLRFIARAITPPGHIRRFDTRFLAAFREDIAVELAEGGPSGELEQVAWLPLGEAMRADIPNITRSVLGDLEAQLRQDRDLAPGGKVPFYRMYRNSFRRDLI